MMARLIIAVISGLAEEAALVVVVLLFLPRFGIEIPLWALICLMVALAANNAVFYLIGSRALKKEPLVGLPAMVGSEGEVVRELSLQGLVKIKGELWQATSAGEEIAAGETVTAVGQDGLRLIVSRSNRHQ